MSNEKINDPILPDIVFFGLILVNLGPLKNFPKSKPPISEAIQSIKHRKKSNFNWIICEERKKIPAKENI